MALIPVLHSTKIPRIAVTAAARTAFMNLDLETQSQVKASLDAARNVHTPPPGLLALHPNFVIVPLNGAMEGKLALGLPIEEKPLKLLGKDNNSLETEEETEVEQEKISVRADPSNHNNGISIFSSGREIMAASDKGDSRLANLILSDQGETVITKIVTVERGRARFRINNQIINISGLGEVKKLYLVFLEERGKAGSREKVLYGWTERENWGKLKLCGIKYSVVREKDQQWVQLKKIVPHGSLSKDQETRRDTLRMLRYLLRTKNQITFERDWTPISTNENRQVLCFTHKNHDYEIPTAAEYDKFRLIIREQRTVSRKRVLALAKSSSLSLAEFFINPLEEKMIFWPNALDLINQANLVKPLKKSLLEILAESNLPGHREKIGYFLGCVGQHLTPEPVGIYRLAYQNPRRRWQLCQNPEPLVSMTQAYARYKRSQDLAKFLLDDKDLREEFIIPEWRVTSNGLRINCNSQTYGVYGFGKYPEGTKLFGVIRKQREQKVAFVWETQEAYEQKLPPIKTDGDVVTIKKNNQWEMIESQNPAIRKKLRGSKAFSAELLQDQVDFLPSSWGVEHYRNAPRSKIYKGIRGIRAAFYYDQTLAPDITEALGIVTVVDGRFKLIHFFVDQEAYDKGMPHLCYGLIAVKENDQWASFPFGVNGRRAFPIKELQPEIISALLASPTLQKDYGELFDKVRLASSNLVA